MLTRYLSGFLVFFKGLGIFLKYHKIKLLTVIPFLLLFISFGSAVYIGYQYLPELLPSEYKFLSFLDPGMIKNILIKMIGFLVGALYLIIVILVTYIISTIITGPFYSFISEEVLVKNGHKAFEANSIKKWLAVFFKMFGVSLVKSLILVVLSICIFIFSFFPVISIAAAFLAFLLIAFDCADYSFEALQFGLSQRFSFFTKYMVEFSGLATFLALTSIVPFSIILTLPFVIMGTTQLVYNLNSISSLNPGPNRPLQRPLQRTLPDQKS